MHTAIKTKYSIGQIIYTVYGDDGDARVHCWKITNLGFKLVGEEVFHSDDYVSAISLEIPENDAFGTIIRDHDILTFDEAKARLLAQIRPLFENALALLPYNENAGGMPHATRRDLVLIESPFAPVQGPEAKGLSEQEYADAIAENVAFAKKAVRDCLSRGESPYATHLFFPQPGMIDDRDADQRHLGIQAGLDWGSRADRTVVYLDRGMSKGMIQGIERARSEGRPVIYRILATGKEFTSQREAMAAI